MPEQLLHRAPVPGSAVRPCGEAVPQGVGGPVVGQRAGLVILTELSETARMAPTLKAVEACPIARATGEDSATETVTAIRFCVCSSSDDLSEPFARAAEYLDSHTQVTVVATSWTEGPCDLGQGRHLTLELIVRGENETDIQPSALEAALAQLDQPPATNTELERAEAHSARGQIDTAATANGWSRTPVWFTSQRAYRRAGVQIHVYYTPAGEVRKAGRGNDYTDDGGLFFRDRLSRRDQDKAATVLGWISEHDVARP